MKGCNEKIAWYKLKKIVKKLETLKVEMIKNYKMFQFYKKLSLFDYNKNSVQKQMFLKLNFLHNKFQPFFTF